MEDLGPACHPKRNLGLNPGFYRETADTAAAQLYEWGVDKCCEQPSYWNYSANQACAQVTAFYEHMFPDLVTNRKVAHFDL